MQDRNMDAAARAAGAADMPGGPAVVCAGLRKRYGEGATAVHALRGVDLTVQRGELLMLVGPSGCGKTTLISVMAGILDPTEGHCRILGQDMTALAPRLRAAFRARNIGFVFQAYNLNPALTAAENVSVPLRICGAPLRESMRKAEAALELVGLGDKAESAPGDLSGGQQQRVAIARALVHQPQLIVCDEPTSALDHANGQRVMELLRRVGTVDGRALVIVTHDARIFEFADRIAELDDGQVTRVGMPATEAGAMREPGAADRHGGGSGARPGIGGDDHHSPEYGPSPGGNGTGASVRTPHSCTD
ncbi:ABC transporter ATP-binding protein [Nitratidesulfovibrio liaohensis]|uniref:ABC transporter ATP-binding protein n=1 Tax=Nitratidesulfovibrio liaohensis TaxID=2604158 RepID=A0ABY9QWQ6_9BACT|nr:ABC transporter ATP-binding protein [Nitratidesulfovibrio liaohensis]WMW63951.1 ABC transporter ATP-binding protein [Nitratidesulfovibrio liaohensis]